MSMGSESSQSRIEKGVGEEMPASFDNSHRWDGDFESSVWSLNSAAVATSFWGTPSTVTSHVPVLLGLAAGFAADWPLAAHRGQALSRAFKVRPQVGHCLVAVSTQTSQSRSRSIHEQDRERTKSGEVPHGLQG